MMEQIRADIRDFKKQKNLDKVNRLTLRSFLRKCILMEGWRLIDGRAALR